MMSNLFSIIRATTPEDVTTEILAYLLREFPVCRKMFLTLIDESANFADYDVQTQCWFPTGRPDLILKDENEQRYVIIENKPWETSSFTTLNEAGQMKRYAEELEGIDAQEKTLCLLATETNKTGLLQEIAIEEGQDVDANEQFLREHYAANYGIDFIIITWQQVIESLGTCQPKYAVVEFLLKELRNYLFSTKTEQLGELQGIDQVVDIEAAAIEMADYIDNCIGGVSDRLLTGFTDLDNLLGGFRPNELIVLASRPGVGKTALALNIVDYVAENQEKTVLVISLEMTRRDLFLRLVCSHAKIDSRKVQKNLFTKTEIGQFLDVANHMTNETSIFFDDTPSRTIAEIASVAKRLKWQHDLQLLVIDHLGLIAPDTPTDSRQEQVAKMVRRLKRLARELQIPVLCLAQLSRYVEQGKETQPRLSHLRESCVIEEVADVVLLLHRQDAGMTKYEAIERDVDNKAELIVAKNRNGATGEIDMIFRKEWSRFFNVEFNKHGDYEDFSESRSF